MTEANTTTPDTKPDSAKTTEPEIKSEPTVGEAGENRTERAENIVTNYALGAILVGAIPFPIVDFVALSGVQLKMLHSISMVYGVEFSDQLGKSVIASLIGGGVSLSVSTNLAAVARSLIKTIPVYGTATGMVSVSILGGASTYAIGKVFIKHFESGGTFLDFDPQRVREYYAKQLEEGKEKLKTAMGKKP